MALARPAALAGAADTAAFLAARPQLFRENPGRALGSVAILGLWLGNVRTASVGGRPGRAATALAATLAAANLGLLAAHLRARIATPRVFSGAVLSGIVLTETLRRR